MKSLAKLTVGEYQQLYAIHTSKEDELDRAVMSVAIITGKPRWEVEDMDLDKFRDISRSIVVLFTGMSAPEQPITGIELNGKRYKVCLNPRKIKYSQYVDIQGFLKGGIIENLHKLFASLLVDSKGKYSGEDHEEIATAIQECNFSVIHSTCVFFSLLWNNSIKALVPFLNEEIRKTQTNLLNGMSLQNITDGYLIPVR
jgi:hypothetical protein